MISFSTRRTISILQKECKHILRDPFTIILTLLIPFLIVIILGNSIEFNLKKISTVVVDHDKSKESKALIETFNSSKYFDTYFVESPEIAFQNIQQEKAKAALYIPPNFNNRLSANKSADIQILVDGADNSSVMAVGSYIINISRFMLAKLTNTNVQKDFLYVRLLFNPELNSKWFAIPGLSAVIIALVSILLTSLTICKERELGSMELLLSTPAESIEIIFGKIIPYAILGWGGFCIVYLAARFLFDVPFFGQLWILLLGTALFILDYLAIGLYISVTIKQQQVAVQVAMLVGLLPTVLLSGFVFPIEYMPNYMQYITVIFPARWYMEIVRGEFIKGSSFVDLGRPFAILVIQGIIIMSSSIIKFKRTLE